MTDKNSWQYLVDQYLANTISKEELELLLQKATEEDMDALTPVLQSHWQKAKEKIGNSGNEWDARFEAMMKEVRSDAPVVVMEKKRIPPRIYRSIAAAVVIALLGGACFIFFQENNQQNTLAQTPVHQNNNDLTPGITGAVLTLANGEQIILDSTGNGILAIQGKAKVMSRNGQIVYDAGDQTKQEFLLNTMSTPRGRQYQLVLSDGTKVWLNASSSIRYPAAFSDKERKVEISGEAYFEVAPLIMENKKEKVPFTVKIISGDGKDRGEIQVLGTHFNVNSYEDETAIKTTLLEGSVKVVKGASFRMLSPGQQAQIKNLLPNNIQIIGKVDVDAVMAWKNGYFSFGNTDLATIFRQISRWYDVDIEYRGEIPNRRFGGEISRNTNASQVLKILEKSKVHCTLEAKKIIVMP